MVSDELNNDAVAAIKEYDDVEDYDDHGDDVDCDHERDDDDDDDEIMIMIVVQRQTIESNV